MIMAVGHNILHLLGLNSQSNSSFNSYSHYTFILQSSKNHIYNFIRNSILHICSFWIPRSVAAGFNTDKSIISALNAQKLSTNPLTLPVTTRIIFIDIFPYNNSTIMDYFYLLQTLEMYNLGPLCLN